MTMTLLLERPEIVAVGKPPLNTELDAPAPPAESGESEMEDEEEDG